MSAGNHLPGLAAEGGRGNTHLLPEHTGKMEPVAKAGLLGNFINRQLRVVHQTAGMFQPALELVLVRGFARDLGEKPQKGSRAETDRQSKLGIRGRLRPRAAADLQCLLDTRVSRDFFQIADRNQRKRELDQQMNQARHFPLARRRGNTIAFPELRDRLLFLRCKKPRKRLLLFRMVRPRQSKMDVKMLHRPGRIR